MHIIPAMMMLLLCGASGYHSRRKHRHYPYRLEDILQFHNAQLSNLVKADPEPAAPKKCDITTIFKPGDPNKKATDIAAKAAMEAKAANDAQCVAGQVAAQHIKIALAEKAFQSAQAAEAALVGKQILLEQLETELVETQAVVQEETDSMQNLGKNMNAAVDAARLATQEFDSLSELQKTAQLNLVNLHTVAMGNQQELQSKQQLLEAAKNRMMALERQLQMAQQDYFGTKEAAYNAACAAVEAKRKTAH